MTKEGDTIDSVPIYRPLIESEELEAVEQALRGGWLGMGTYVGEFEQAIEKVIGAGDRRAVAVSTGHAALHLGLIIAGVGPGDEVIVPSLSHLADVQAIVALGGEPVLCDIEDPTLCLDPRSVAELIGPRTRAVLSLDYGGHLADHGAIELLALRHQLRVVHDAAHSFGSALGGAMVGSFSDICMFSFDPAKALTCIDAGVVVVRTDAEVQRLRELRVLGATQPAELAYRHTRTWQYDVTESGFRYHLSNVHAALGLAQLAKLDAIRWSRQSACQLYQDRLRGVEGLRVPEAGFEEVNPFLYYIRVRDGRRHELREHLAARGIATGIHWVPVHTLSRFRDCRLGSLAVTERAAAEILSLPLHSGMQEETVHRVCDAIESFFG